MQLFANTTSPFVRIARTAMIEKGLDLPPTLVDPWTDDPRLRAANAATRVPTLVLDDGTALTESMLILQWLEATRPAPQGPALFGTAATAAGVLSRAGIAMGAIEAAVVTIITRKVTAPVLFDDTPVGRRRQRSMIDGMKRLEAVVGDIATDGGPAIDAIAAVTLYDYQQLRFGDQRWLPKTPQLAALAAVCNRRPSFEKTKPYVA